MTGTAEAAAIAAMRRQRGSEVTLRRLVSGGAPIDTLVVAVIREFAPQEIANGIIQGDRRATISDDAIAAAAWPGPPRKGDQIIQDGRKYTLVSDPNTVKMGEAVLSHRMQITGG